MTRENGYKNLEAMEIKKSLNLEISTWQSNQTALDGRK